MKKIVSIFGPSECREGDSVYDEAYIAGQELAAAGYAIVTGGYEGVMEAASRGAAARGGRVIGVVAEVYSARGREPNAYVSRHVRVKSAVDQLMELIDLSDASITIGASVGTMVEVIVSWDHMIKGFVNPRPLILVGDAWRPFQLVFEVSPLMSKHLAYISFTQTAQSAVELIISKLGQQPMLPELPILSTDL